MQKSTSLALAGIPTVLGLVITLYALGFVACCLPITTQGLSFAFSGSDNPQTPFSKEDLQISALVTQDYVVFSHDVDKLASCMQSINQNANTPYANASREEIMKAPEEYTLDETSLSHLDDVYYALHGPITWSLCGVALLTLLALVTLRKKMSRQAYGRILIAGGSGTILAGAIPACFAVADFTSFFNTFHALFFESGTWLFSYESLLITMYPTFFWIGMGIVWLATTFLLSVAVTARGWTILRSQKQKRPANA